MGDGRKARTLVGEAFRGQLDLGDPHQLVAALRGPGCDREADEALGVVLARELVLECGPVAVGLRRHRRGLPEVAHRKAALRRVGHERRFAAGTRAGHKARQKLGCVIDRAEDLQPAATRFARGDRLGQVAADCDACFARIELNVCDLHFALLNARQELAPDVGEHDLVVLVLGGVFKAHGTARTARFGEARGAIAQQRPGAQHPVGRLVV